jgi:hypothetical protein
MSFLWNYRTTLLEVLLGGFFAVACIRASIPAAADGQVTFSDLFRFPGRIERLRRSRWQWFAMVAFLLVVRLQGGLPLMLEGIVVVQFVLFLALPNRADAGGRTQRSGHAPIVGRR